MAAPKPCKVADCSRPKKKGKHFCRWHWLARQSSDVQASAARTRRAEATGPIRNRVTASEWPDGERWCSGCQSFVPKFYCSGSRCKACVSMAAHEKRLGDVYGIDSEEYQRIWEAQGRRCAICRNQPRTIRFAVDHDHKTGEVRGILCKRCNHDLLGGAHDDVIMLFRAITYLIYPPAVQQAFKPTPDHVLTALRERLLADYEAQRAQAQRKLPPPQEPPF